MPYVNVRMLTGRTHQQKAELAEAITTALTQICGSPAAGTHVVIDEVEKENWAVGGQLVADRDN